MHTVSHAIAQEILCEGVITTLTSDEHNDLCWAIGLAIEAADDNRTQMLSVAAHLRNGHAVPMFADGEDGARAADLLADNFYRGRQRLIELKERLIDSETIIMVTPENAEVV